MSIEAPDLAGVIQRHPGAKLVRPLGVGDGPPPSCRRQVEGGKQH
jgi:hypothetical protein